MSTELERLKVWMVENNVSRSVLAKSLLYTAQSINRIVEGKGGISPAFYYRFLVRYGEQAAREVFAPTRFQEYKIEPRVRKVLSPEERDARANASRELMRIRSRKDAPYTLHARNYLCHGCLDPAIHMHHQSYHPNDSLCLVPLCGFCHSRIHVGTLHLDFGVVPTAVGLVRIAISNPTYP